ncbi:hypothetical protein TNCV_2996931 [Trichonephila clavipes]|nr:hypothetical protein TNCV_2996931 [Trichonephila clavipes]
MFSISPPSLYTAFGDTLYINRNAYILVVRSQIVEARLAGASLTETSQLLAFPEVRCLVMTAYTYRGKTSMAKKNTGGKEKLSERERRVLKRIAMSKKEAISKPFVTDVNARRRLYSGVTLIKPDRLISGRK